MNYSVKNLSNEVIVSFSKDIMDYEEVIFFLERVENEFLAKKINFDEKILELGNEIATNWWKENKSKFIKQK